MIDRPQKRILYPLGILLLVLFSGCSNGSHESGDSATFSKEQDLFEIVIDIKNNGSNKFILTRKIKYNGDSDVTITHSDPLISVVISSTGSDVEHSFDTVKRETKLKSKELVVYGDPLAFIKSEKETFISIQTDFFHNTENYSIPLNFKY